MRIGIVCPYAWDVPGGVSAHVRDLAVALQAKGHVVSVLAPAEDDEALPNFVASVGRPKALRYNGSVARVSFGPVTARRVAHWIDEGRFDVLHVHEPLAPSISALACWAARGPIVATWHSSMDRSRMMLSLQRLAFTVMEKVTARIAVSEAARTTLVEHIGGDAVIIPNGVDASSFADAAPLDGWPGSGRAIVFLGRIDEPRKGLAVLLAAMPAIQSAHPGIRLLVAGPGDAQEALADCSTEVTQAVTTLGLIPESLKAHVLASGDVYIAPNTGGESFGIVLLEAMAAGTPVVATDLEAFSRVLDGGRFGRMFRNGDPASLAVTVNALLDSPGERESLRKAGLLRAAQFDWSTIADRVLEVYESVVVPGVPVESDLPGLLAGRWATLGSRSEETL